MTNGTAIWEALRKHLPRRQWIPLEEVYSIVESNMTLDAEDLSRDRAHSIHPQWKTTVRTLLRVKKRAGLLRGRPAGNSAGAHS